MACENLATKSDIEALQNRLDSIDSKLNQLDNIYSLLISIQEIVGGIVTAIIDAAKKLAANLLQLLTIRQGTLSLFAPITQ